MIISFSGIGGSGKSTQITLLEKALRERGASAFIVTLRDKFLWPHVAQWFKREQIQSPNDPSANAVKQNAAKNLLRDIFYFLDSWRVYIWHILSHSLSAPYVLCDRFFEDFFVELAFSSGGNLNTLLMRLLPRPDFAFYFDIPPKTADERKHEWDIATLERQRDLYVSVQKTLDRKRTVSVNAAQSAPEIAEAIRIVVDAAKNQGTSFAFPLFLLRAIISERPGVVVLCNIFLTSSEPLLSAARMNRCVWGAAQKLNRLSTTPEVQNVFSAIRSTGETLNAKRDKTHEFLKSAQEELGAPVTIIKQSDEIEIGTDVDAIVASAADFERVVAFCAQKGKIAHFGKAKADIFIDGLLPIDLHQNISYNGFAYVSAQFFTEHPREAQILTIASHSINELTLLTLGDILRVSKVEAEGSPIDWAAAYAEARRFHWEKALEGWLRLVRDAAESGLFSLPLYISPVALTAMKLEKYIGDRTLSASDIVNTLRALRARALGKIPFHDSWVSESAPKEQL